MLELIDASLENCAAMSFVDDQQRYHQMMTVAEISKQYGVGRTTIYEALGVGSLQAVVVGKRGTRILRGDLEKWINNLKKYKPKKEP